MKTKTFKLERLLMVVFIAITTIITAQKSENSDFTYDIGGKIEKMTVTDSGVLLITHGNGLAGIKPGQKGSQLWLSQGVEWRPL